MKVMILAKYSINDIASESDRTELSDVQKKSTQGLVTIAENSGPNDKEQVKSN
jgi:hypothetical protein